MNRFRADRETEAKQSVGSERKTDRTATANSARESETVVHPARSRVQRLEGAA